MRFQTALDEVILHQEKAVKEARKAERAAYIALACFVISAGCHILVAVLRHLGFE